MAGGWSVGILEQSQGKDCCGETDRGDMREEIEVGNACGENLGSHGSKAILLSHAVVAGAITKASLSPHTSIGS